MTWRRGFSLVELLAVMSACAVILTGSAALLHRAMRAQSETRYFFDAERSALRLARQFRRDVRQASRATIDADSFSSGAFLRLELSDGGAIEYRREETGIARVAAGPRGAEIREAYAFARGSRIDLRQVGAPTRLVLTIATDPPQPPLAPPGKGAPAPGIRDVPVSTEVVAALGRDLWRPEAPTDEEGKP